VVPVDPTEQAGRPARIGRYELVSELGSGGQGTTYLGRAPDGTQVAVKVLHRQWLNDPYQRRKFAAEFEAARKVGDSHTAQVLDADVYADPPYIVSEYIDGGTLHAWVRDKGPLTAAQLERLAVQLSYALRAIHREGVVHRDLKPVNVLLGRDGWRVIDFGVARAIEESGPEATRFFHSPGYTAPERYADDRGGGRADIYSWACTIGYAALGRSPVVPPRATDAQLAAAMGPRLARIVRVCLAEAPEARPDADGLVRMVMDLPAQERTPVTVPMPPRRPPAPPPGHPPPSAARPPSAGRRRSRRGLLTGSAAVLTAAAVVVAAAVLRPDRPARTYEPRGRTSTPSTPAAAHPPDLSAWPPEKVFSPDEAVAAGAETFTKAADGVTNGECVNAVHRSSAAKIGDAWCLKTVRARYLDGFSVHQLTLGIMVMHDPATAARFAGGPAAPRFAPLPYKGGGFPPAGDAADADDSGASAFQVDGAYIAFAVVRYADGRPSPAGDPELVGLADAALPHVAGLVREHRR
jgi:serine/threonine protein kinase